MSKADMMFEKLGYEKAIDNGNYIKYKKDDDNVYYFQKDVKTYYKSGEYDGMCGDTTMQEIKAIIEKCKELRMDGGIEYGRYKSWRLCKNRMGRHRKNN